MILFMRFVVKGHSMEPTFRQGQSVFVSGIPYLFVEPKIGDVVIIKDPRDGRLLLKRIKSIQLRHPGKRSASRIRRGFWSSQNDNHNKYFVAGDNPKESTDSRSFGLITKDHILAKVILTGS